MLPPATAATASERARGRLIGAPEMKARSPVKFMDVFDVKVTDKKVLLASNMMIETKNTSMKERIWINRVASEIVFQSLYPDTGALLHSMGAQLSSRILLARCH